MDSFSFTLFVIVAPHTNSAVNQLINLTPVRAVLFSFELTFVFPAADEG